jgi:hypothetical protein
MSLPSDLVWLDPEDQAFEEDTLSTAGPAHQDNPTATSSEISMAWDDDHAVNDYDDYHMLVVLQYDHALALKLQADLDGECGAVSIHTRQEANRRLQEAKSK